MFGWFKKTFKWVKKVPGFLRKLFGDAAIDAFRKAAKELLKREVGRIVLAIVAELALSNLSDSLKRETAFKRIKEQLRVSGKTIPDSILNILIEFAVQRLKEKSGVTLLPTE